MSLDPEYPLAQNEFLPSRFEGELLIDFGERFNRLLQMTLQPQVRSELRHGAILQLAAGQRVELRKGPLP